MGSSLSRSEVVRGTHGWRKQKQSMGASFFTSEVVNNLLTFIRPIIVQSDRKGRFPIGDEIVHSYAVAKVPFRSQRFRSINPIRESRRKNRFFSTGYSRIGMLGRKRL